MGTSCGDVCDSVTILLERAEYGVPDAPEYHSAEHDELIYTLESAFDELKGRRKQRMCNNGEPNLPFVADFEEVRFGDRVYKVRVLHYYPGKEVNRDNLPGNVAHLVDEAQRMGSKRMTAAWIDPGDFAGPKTLIGSAFCKHCPEDSGGATEGRLRAKDRLRTVVEFLGGTIVWPIPQEESGASA